VKNAVGREIPECISGYPQIRPFGGAFANLGTVMRTSTVLHSAVPGRSKLLPDIQAAIAACGLKDGATISFHHHLRNGDGVLNMVLAELARLGLRDITIAPSSLFPVHAPLIEHMKSGVVTGLHTTYIAGPVGDAIARGALALPAFTTPGETIDAVVTDAGVAVNPQRGDLRERLLTAGLPVVPIEALRERAAQYGANVANRPAEGRVVAVVEYRDGTVIDVVRQIP
jgi:citrate lyase alpha subunit